MKRLIPVFLAAFLLCSTFASGARIDFYSREVLITEEKTEFADTILFDEMPDQMSIPLLFKVRGFSTSATIENYNCTAIEKDYGHLLRCDLPEDSDGRLQLIFSADDLTKEVDGHRYFENTVKVPYRTEKLVYTTKLEGGLVLIPENTSSPFPPYSPRSGEKGSDGRRIFVYWTRENLEKEDTLSVSVSYESIEVPEDRSFDFYTIVVGMLIIIVLIGMVLVIKAGENGSLALKEDEREIVDMLKNVGGQMKQRRIVDNTDFSKAKVSRLIKDLEERGILEKEKVGRTNRIYLKEKR